MERFYGAFLLRIAIERLERQKDLIIAALHANSVYDEHKEARRDEAVRNVEDQFNDMIGFIRRAANGESDAEESEDDGYDEKNPFWAAARRGVESQLAPRSDEGDGEFTAAELVNAESDAQELREIMSRLDQS